MSSKATKPKTRRYQTTYDQIDVGCESCHGPGSNHVSLMTAQTQSKTSTNKVSNLGSANEDPRRTLAQPSAADMGFELALAARGQWVRAPDEDLAHRSTPLDNTVQADNCGRCHSRRATLGDYHYGQSLLDTHRLSYLSHRCTGTTAKFATRSTYTAHLCKAKWHRQGLSAVTATTHIAMSSLPKAMASAPSAQTRDLRCGCPSSSLGQ